MTIKTYRHGFTDDSAAQEIEYLREDEVDIDEGEEDDMEDFGADVSDGDEDDSGGDEGTSGTLWSCCALPREVL